MTERRASARFTLLVRLVFVSFFSLCALAVALLSSCAAQDIVLGDGISYWSGDANSYPPWDTHYDPTDACCTKADDVWLDCTCPPDPCLDDASPTDACGDAAESSPEVSAEVEVDGDAGAEADALDAADGG